MTTFIDFFCFLLSLPFWFAAFVCSIAGVFGTVTENGKPYLGNTMKPRMISIFVGLCFGLIAYGLVHMQ